MIRHTRTAGAALAAATGVLLGSIGPVSAQEAQRTLAAPTAHFSNVSVADLEKAFWMCDYLATTQGVSDVRGCSAVSESLKQRRFAGDLDGLLLWWRENKVARHGDVAAARASLSKERHHE